MTGCPHFDLTQPETFMGGHPREVYSYLRNEEPVYWHENPDGEGFWVITRQQDLDFVSKNPALFSSHEKTCLLNDMSPEQVEINRMMMINMDPPQHLKYRRLVQRTTVSLAARS